MSSIYHASIDPDLGANQAALQDLPGNILTAHARDHVAVVFFTLSGDQAAARRFVRQMGDVVTSAQAQRRTYLDWRDYKIPEPTFYGFLLSISGYFQLGLATESEGLPTAVRSHPFVLGMRQGEASLSPPTGNRTWESEYMSNRMDGAVIVADWDETACARAVSSLVNQPVWLAAVTWKHVEYGRTYRNDLKQRVEHFGYADGISGPLFLKDEIDEAAQRAQVGPRWDPEIAASMIAVKEISYPARIGGPGPAVAGFGSYFVFRKLEQNVAGFGQHVERLARKLNPAAPDLDFAGGCLVGRRRDGTPLALTPHPLAQAEPRNDFDYSTDPVATRCPMHAHVRKVNDRTGRTNFEQIVRRGITYGKRPVTSTGALDPDPAPIGGVGLLFMAYMKELSQFITMQETWMNTDFPASKAGNVDPICGFSAARVPDLNVANSWGQAAIQPAQQLPFAGFVTARGGAYLFAPPIGFLKSCA